eukprot:5560803-Lingulodinium_polyedra.AAC.1
MSWSGFPSLVVWPSRRRAVGGGSSRLRSRSCWASVCMGSWRGRRRPFPSSTLKPVWFGGRR